MLAKQASGLGSINCFALAIRSNRLLPGSNCKANEKHSGSNPEAINLLPTYGSLIPDHETGLLVSSWWELKPSQNASTSLSSSFNLTSRTYFFIYSNTITSSPMPQALISSFVTFIVQMTLPSGFLHKRVFFDKLPLQQQKQHNNSLFFTLSTNINTQ